MQMGLVDKRTFKHGLHEIIATQMWARWNDWWLDGQKIPH